MGKCMIDHTLEDVKGKLADQTPFMPEELIARVSDSLTEEADQEFLNDVFHLLKKYDLADETEREERNEKLNDLVK
ncbi:50S ribosomal protein L7ae [Fictibacillus sp. BK138]|uniref:50S ribosomal protein L7ae n=1 Tax=Fictibacillus sp. BK138 TaxID=2512121 RepID=UPI001029A561|nr:50S ribosomal protein L7ae [Fictibacillus sp. BK138]RZT21492.1 hypothetical protein EV282_0554 [Fictibacillus sp. BK138]